jgi:hypothetical protein
LAAPAAELGDMAEQTLDKATGIGSQVLDAVSDRIEGLFAALGDLFAPPAPPTKEQAEGTQRAAEERQTQAEADRERSCSRQAVNVGWAE